VLFLVRILLFRCFIDFRDMLVRLLIIPIFLYRDVVYFPSLTGLQFRRLELAFNACTRYVFGLRRFDHISDFSIGILGYTLFEHLELRLRLTCFIHKISLVGASSYLSSLLVLGRSSRHIGLSRCRVRLLPPVYAVIQLSIGVYVFGMYCLLLLSLVVVFQCVGERQGSFFLHRRCPHAFTDLISINNFISRFNRKYLFSFFLVFCFLYFTSLLNYFWRLWMNFVYYIFLLSVMTNAISALWVHLINIFIMLIVGL
jgi:hypothetical protein